jgi:hypothetical protein
MMVTTNMKNEKELYVLTYEHIDSYDFIKKPEDVYSSKSKLRSDLKYVRQKFLDAGWEGDGEIGLIWIPPFLDQSIDYNNGETIWHVKQYNNGTSFLGFSSLIQSAKLLDQNKKIKEGDKFIKPISIIDNENENLHLSLDKNESLINEISGYIKKNTISRDIAKISIGFIQNELIALFIDFIDECYLQYLIHVLSSNNPDKLKLKSFNVKLDLSRISEISESGTDHWLTINQIISCIWEGFKFLSFKEKFKEIQKCVDFQGNDSLNFEISKHVVIRNCIQHHQWQLDDGTIKTIGVDRINILTEAQKSKTIQVWKTIELSTPEIISLIVKIREFLNLYTSHVKSRVKERHFLHNYI